ncbi:MAG: sodium:solute symporter family transporter [Pseudomonadales bacterium]
MATLNLIDLAVIALVMIAVTWLGHHLSGSIASRRSFFEADGSLPWWAVSASIIATLVSSVTFVAVPAAVFIDGGNLTYLQVIIGLALGKLFIASILVRSFYESEGINTTYEYIGARIDAKTGTLSMWVGLGLNLINSAIKLLTAAIVLDVISQWGIVACCLAVVAFSMLWSALAGIKTVIWTDFLLFVMFASGAVFALVYLALQIQAPLPDALLWLDAEAKLILFDFSTDPQRRYTLWAAIIGSIGLSLALGGTQGTWQRVKACRSVADARKAYNYSALFYLLHLVILGVGLALALFYREQPLASDVATAISAQPDRIFPYFIVTEIPVGLSGLFIAAIFAAAISTLDSAMTESAELTVRHLYEPLIRPDASEAHYLRVSRLSLLFWGLAFAAGAVFINRFSGEGLLDLTFKLPNYLYGAIFGTILLARMGRGRLSSFLVGFASASGCVAVLASYQIAFFWWCPVSGLLMVCVVLLCEQLMPAKVDISPGAAAPADNR